MGLLNALKKLTESSRTVDPTPEPVEGKTGKLVTGWDFAGNAPTNEPVTPHPLVDQVDRVKRLRAEIASRGDTYPNKPPEMSMYDYEQMLEFQLQNLKHRVMDNTSYFSEAMESIKRVGRIKQLQKEIDDKGLAIPQQHLLSDSNYEQELKQYLHQFSLHPVPNYAAGSLTKSSGPMSIKGLHEIKGARYLDPATGIWVKPKAPAEVKDLNTTVKIPLEEYVDTLQANPIVHKVSVLFDDRPNEVTLRVEYLDNLSKLAPDILASGNEELTKVTSYFRVENCEQLEVTYVQTEVIR